MSGLDAILLMWATAATVMCLWMSHEWRVALYNWRRCNDEWFEHCQRSTRAVVKALGYDIEADRKRASN